jgi:hypothetical protein
MNTPDVLEALKRAGELIRAKPKEELERDLEDMSEYMWGFVEICERFEYAFEDFVESNHKNQ